MLKVILPILICFSRIYHVLYCFIIVIGLCINFVLIYQDAYENICHFVGYLW